MSLNSYQKHQLEHKQLGNNSFINHNGLNGLLNDDHTQYACLAGRSGGQTLHGGFEEGDCLTLRTSSHADMGLLEAYASQINLETADGYRLVIKAGDILNAQLTDGSGTPLYLQYANDANLICCLSDTGKVGIGILDPLYRLDVSGDCRISDTVNLTSLTASKLVATDVNKNLVSIEQSSIDHNSLSGLTANDSHTQYALLAGRTGGQTIIGGTDASNTLILQSTSNETLGSIQLGVEVSKAIILDEITGNIGIGKLPATTKLEINGSVLATSFTATGGMAIMRNDPNNHIRFLPQGGSGAHVWWAGASRSNSNVAAAGSFYIWDETIQTTRFQISPTGNVGIGRAATTNILEINGNASKSTSGDWLANSDICLKKDISIIYNPLEKLSQLRGVNYYWKEPQNHGDEAFQHSGFIAQEVETVFPNWVQTDNMGIKSIKMELDAYFVEAIKLLMNEIAVLKKEIIQLKNN